MGLVSLGAEVAPASRWQFPLLIFSGCPALPECGGGSRCEAWRRGAEQRSAQARGGVRGPATGEGRGGCAEEELPSRWVWAVLGKAV